MIRKHLGLIGIIFFPILTLIAAQALAAIGSPIKIVDSTTPLPDGSGIFQFPYEVAADNGVVSFKSRISSTQIGIYLLGESGLEYVPGSIYQFHFDHSFNGSHVAFRAKNNDSSSDGLYTNLNGSMSRFVSGNTPVPGTSVTFGLSLEDPYIGDGVVVFKGRDPSDGGAQVIWQYDGTTIANVVSFATPVPGAVGTWVTMRDPAIDDRGVVVFLGELLLNDGSVRQGIFKKANTSQFLQEVAGPRVQIPGGTGNFEFVDEPSITGGDIAFQGRGANGQVGVYAQLDGVLTRIADKSTPIPEWTGNFTSLSGGVTFRNHVAFVGLGGTSFSHRGIYIRLPDGTIEKVVDTNDTLDGKGISGFRVYKQSLDDSRLYYQVSFTDGSVGIYASDVIALSELPIADAGSDQVVAVGDEVQLSGAASQDDNTSAVDLQYIWAVVSGPAGTLVEISGGTTINPSFVPDLPGNYELSLIVVDSDGQESSSVTVTVSAELTPAFLFERAAEGTYSYQSINDYGDGFYSYDYDLNYWYSPLLSVEGLFATNYDYSYSYNSGAASYDTSYETGIDLFPTSGGLPQRLIGSGDPSPTTLNGSVQSVAIVGRVGDNPLASVYTSGSSGTYQSSLVEIDPQRGTTQTVVEDLRSVPIAGDTKVLDWVWLMYDSGYSGQPIYSGYDRDTCYEYYTYNYYYSYSYCRRYLRGLYSVSAGEARKIVDSSDVVPGTQGLGYFQYFSRAVSDPSDESVVFVANWKDSDGTYRTGLFRVFDGVITNLIDSTTEGWDRGYLGGLDLDDGVVYVGGTQYRSFVDDTGAQVWSRQEGIFTVSGSTIDPIATGGSASRSGYDFDTYDYDYVASTIDSWNFDANDGVLLYNRSTNAYSSSEGRYEYLSSIVWKEAGAERRVIDSRSSQPITILGKDYKYVDFYRGAGALKGRSVAFTGNSYDYSAAYDAAAQRYTYSNTGIIDILVARFDTDRDGLGDDLDNCPAFPNPLQEDSDGDGIGDVCEDSDSDTVRDGIDNCPLTFNEFQENSDLDDYGNACDVCQFILDDQSDIDGDGLGDACDDNSDFDSIVDALDNCPYEDNELQDNLDKDDLGDVCDPDVDGDGIANEIDGNWDGVAFVDQSRQRSFEFSDHELGGKSYGRLQASGGLALDVQDAPDSSDGVLVSATVGAGTARYRACGVEGRDAWVDLDQGSIAVITCGSLRVEALANVPRVVFDEEIVVEIGEGGSAQIADLPNGELAIENVSDQPQTIDLKLGPDISVEMPEGSIGQVSEPEPGQYEIQNSPESTQPITAEVNGVKYTFKPGDVGVPVEIDIKPGSTDNTINLGSAGGVPVAILSSPTFDASEVDPYTVTLASAALKKLRGKGQVAAAIQDVNEDGIDDLLVQIDSSALEIGIEATDAILKGSTYSGVSIMGKDTVRIMLR